MPKISLPTLSPQRQKQIVVGISSIVFLIIWLPFFVVPQRESLADLQARVKKVRSEVAEVRAKMVQLPAMETELRQLASQYDSAVITTPPEEQLPELFEMIAQAARNSQVRLIGVKPKVEIGQVTPGASGFLELPVQVDASGGYHQLGMFVDALERSKSLLRIEELKIQQDPKDIWHHEATFIIHAYLFPGGEKGKSS